MNRNQAQYSIFAEGPQLGADSKWLPAGESPSGPWGRYQKKHGMVARRGERQLALVTAPDRSVTSVFSVVPNSPPLGNSILRGWKLLPFDQSEFCLDHLHQIGDMVFAFVFVEVRGE
jgi:hypothetical protein